MRIAIIGATGLVGTTILKNLEERNFPVTEIIPGASERSVGKEVEYKNTKYKVVSLQTAVEMNPDVAIFSAGGSVSKEWAPKFVEKGIYVIDNSSQWRMNNDCKLIIPEINGNTLTQEDKLIPNPNCSTIQMLMAIAPLHKSFGIKRLVISTYQSVTGTGVKAIEQLENESKGIEGEKAYPHQIHKNALPHCDVFLENGYTKEEMKLVNETHKILNDNSIGITATAVRIPVVGGHSESINITLDKASSVKEIQNLLGNTEGVVVQDNPETNEYPMPFYSNGKDEVFVGRIRQDFSAENTFNLWVVADNLKKGAATNAIQIAEYLNKKGWIG